MCMDAVLWLSAATLGLVIAAFAIAYRQFRAISRRIAPVLSMLTQNPDPMAGLAAKLHAWAFAESVNDKGETVYTTSPQFRELVSRLVPEFIGQGMEWAKTNIKLKEMAPGIAGGGGLASLAAPGMLKQIGIPKEWQGIAQLLLQYGRPFLGKMFGGGTAKGTDEYPPFPEELRKK